MQEHQITLVDIWREAALLEMNVDISTGHLDIYQRASSSNSFYSSLTLDDPRALAEAWAFLQRQRLFFNQLDEARRELANCPPQRGHKTFVGLGYLVMVVVAIDAGALVALLTSDSTLALLVFVLIFATLGLSRPGRMC